MTPCTVTRSVIPCSTVSEWSALLGALVGDRPRRVQLRRRHRGVTGPVVGHGQHLDDHARDQHTVAGSTTATECTTIPEETAGPYPGDGSNGPDVLTQDGVVRADIRSSFGGATGTASGVPARSSSRWSTPARAARR